MIMRQHSFNAIWHHIKLLYAIRDHPEKRRGDIRLYPHKGPVTHAHTHTLTHTYANKHTHTYTHTHTHTLL
jgi:hypothetical protein